MPSPYRSPPPAGLPGLVWGGSLRRRATQIRVEEDAVAIDAPDPMGVVLLLTLFALAPLALERGAFTSAVAFAIWLTALATARVHLRVRPGSARVVRTVLGIPWALVWRGGRYAAPAHPWRWSGFDFDELVVPPRDGRDAGLVLLDLGPGDEALGDTLEREIRRVLAGERWDH